MARSQKKKMNTPLLRATDDYSEEEEEFLKIYKTKRVGFKELCERSDDLSSSSSSSSSSVLSETVSSESSKQQQQQQKQENKTRTTPKQVGGKFAREKTKGSSLSRDSHPSNQPLIHIRSSEGSPEYRSAKQEKCELKPKAKLVLKRDGKTGQKCDDSDIDEILSKLNKMSWTTKKSTPGDSNDSTRKESNVAQHADIEKSCETTQLVDEPQKSTAESQQTVSAKTLKNRQKRLKKKKSAETEDQEEDRRNTGTLQTQKPGTISVAARLAQQRRLLVESEQRRLEEERRQNEELERQRLEKEKEILKNLEEEKERKRQARLEAKQRQRKEGKPVTSAEKERAKRMEEARKLLLEQMNNTMLQFPKPNSSETKKKPSATDSRKKKRQQVLETMYVPEPHVQEEKTIEAEEIVDENLVTKAEKTFLDISDWDKSGEDDTGGLSVRSAIPSSSLPPAQSSLKVKDAAQFSIPVKAKFVEHPIISCEQTAQKSKTCEKNVLKPTQSELKETQKKHSTLKETPPEQKHLRSPICCILGHVDTGKTKLLDKIRHTDVQAGEAGGITQQIGTTFFPKTSLLEQCQKVDVECQIDVPGLLIIDTPGHESFNNLRSRGSSLCDIAILVVDIMHGLEPQTRESLELLRGRKCPFLIALNKIDRLYGWESCSWAPARSTLERQKDCTQQEFATRLSGILLQLSETGLNCNLWWDIGNVKKTVSVVPTSALTGEGIPDLLYLLVSLTQSVMTRCLKLKDEFQCTVLEVKTIEGLGATVDAILISGTLSVNDKLVLCGLSGPIVTTIRALLTPQPLKELRVKGDYIHHKQISAAMGVKICAQGLDEAVAGTSLFVLGDGDEDKLEQLQEDVMADMNSIISNVDRSGVGVYVMASTLGSLEALLQFLKTSKIPVFAVNIGPVHKLDVKKASVMREKGHAEYSCILAFDVKVDVEASKDAQILGVKIFTADIIYHLFDSFNKYVADVFEQKRKDRQSEAIFPCILSIYPNCIFNKKDPIVLGVKVEEGICKVGTPLCIPEKDNFFIGRIGSLEHNKKPVDTAKRGDDIAIKIIGDTSVMYGRHFDHTFKMYSRITRDSIDYLKEFYREDLKKDDWKLIVKMKKTFNIV